MHGLRRADSYTDSDTVVRNNWAGTGSVTVDHTRGATVALNRVYNNALILKRSSGVTATVITNNTAQLGISVSTDVGSVIADNVMSTGHLYSRVNTANNKFIGNVATEFDAGNARRPQS